MSNIIPPLLSNSPPPMIGSVIDDEDDEFGNFAVVNNLPYDDDDGLSLAPVDINIKEIPESPHLFKADKDFQDRRKDDDNGEVHNEYENDKKINGDSFQYFPETPPDISQDEEEAGASDSATSIDNEVEIINDLNVVEHCESLPEPIEDECDEFYEADDDFADFNAFSNTPSTNLEVENHTKIVAEKELPIAQTNVVEDDDDNDFGDFNDYSTEVSQTQSDIDEPVPEKAENVVLSMFPIVEQQTEEFQDENFICRDIIFCQLKDVTDTLALSYQWSKSNSQHFLLQALNIDTRNILYGPRWNESMPRYAATLGFAPLEPMKSEAHNSSNGETTSSHSEVVEQSEIPLAEFDWVGSGLTNPLEMTPKKIIEKQQAEVGISKQINDDKKIEISIAPLQTNSDTDSIKSLKLIANTENDKTYDDFDDFSSFQSTKNDTEFNSFQSSKDALESWPTLRETQITNINQSSKIENEPFENWTSLRETHISNSKIDEPSWLKPTIVTPDLPRKEVAASQFEEDEDEFTDFQTGNIDQTPVTEPNTPDLKVPATLSQLQSSSQSLPILAPLQPAILQPVKAENAPTAINWPDPGVTDEELQRFDMIFQPAVTNNIEISKVVTKPPDEDDWSDFVSNQAAQLSTNQVNTITPATRRDVPNVQERKNDQLLVKSPLPFSQNGFPTSLVSNQYVVLNDTSPKTDDIEDEWSDFVSSQPVQESPSRVPKPSIPKLNLDWNGPPQFTSWSTSITPNIITNPVSFESFQSFAPLDGDLLRNRTVNKRNPSVVIQPKKSTVPSISSVPDLEFIAPKNRTWKK